MDMDTRELIIIGGGPAGYTAALYAARADLNPLVIEGFNWGGQLMITSDVENYPGFVEGIMGPELMASFRSQAERFGADYLTDDVTRVDFSEQPLRVWVGDDEYTAKAVIVATGASARQLGLPSERAMHGKGVTYCAVCDGAFYRDKDVIVVGGGDSAIEEAGFLTKFASKVTIVHRRPDFRASAIMIDRARENDKIEFALSAVVEEVLSDDSGMMRGVRLRDTETDETNDLDAAGLFVAVGHDPNTQLFLDRLAPAEHDDEPRPTIEAHGDYVFAVFLIPVLVAEEDHVYYQEVDFVMTEDTILAVRKTLPGREPFEPDQATIEKAREEPAGMTAYRLVDDIAERFLDLVDALNDEIDELEDNVETWDAERVRERLSHLRHDILHI